ncbi:hypothetical protein A2774_02820 [Candidatus Roizmanbacteria bacterium RIFCSPHIGHO2_01_FULL_39_12c]|uniref:Uncharacterized protein n=1 Tax=Candidatus Roizmanbacteria bacterium RIFCSPHIGHO2_01_FULL_39_12c TaxID=1802031 RepID=A0A1F7GBX3_9BACT|nr:MAG: hypothetical protein A2774_02820 [Candidatus Roizmanbacteria bacterium RIFCSPHIGHO2_01_FULL_39_12c]
MKIIVTHMSPDLDAIASTWLIKKFLPGWSDATINFVSAGKTLHDKSPDSNPETIHVDTGLGKFDHHQSADLTCSTKKVLDFLNREKHIKKNLQKPLEILANFAIDDDHFLEIYYPEPTADRYEFLINNLIDGLKIVLVEDIKLTEFVFTILDGMLEKLKLKVISIQELNNGIVFTSYLGKSFIIETGNDEVLKSAQKAGYNLVIRKDPKYGNIRIKTPPDPNLDLTPLYNKILKLDKEGYWFFHSSKHMLLNGSPKRPDQKASPLTVKKLVEIIKSI